MSSSRYNYGLEFAGKRTNDFGIDVLTKEIGFPKKKKIVVRVPFSNEDIDFSNIYDDQIFEDREVTVEFMLIDRETYSKESIYMLWTKVVNWLMGYSSKQILKDDIMSDYYYLAEVQEEPSLEEFIKYGRLKVKFNCYPFRIHSLYEGNDIWDTFNFDLDVAQFTKFTFTHDDEIILINNGVSTLQPAIISSVDGISINSIKTVSGTNKYDDFFLVKGINKVQIKMNGIKSADIEFQFRQELI